jgi:hypothetical protein
MCDGDIELDESPSPKYQFCEVKTEPTDGTEVLLKVTRLLEHRLSIKIKSATGLE